MSEDSNEEERRASEAATKIQANFRGYRVRKQLKQFDKDPSECPEEEEEEEQQKDKKGTTKQQPSKDSLEQKSATKIQAGVRGFLVRKRQQAAKAAATRIQAGFRGFRTRKLLKQNGQ